jgi:Putative GTPase activating protein for Arf
MLQKPGSSTPRPARSAKAAAQESPEEVLRKLSRLPSNKKCCDCTSKLPNIVNVTIGAFLCSTCAGIHRELPSTPRIKSIGHTTFSAEEVAFIGQQGGNERVNAVYLENYSASRERLRPPTDNTDVHLLRTWIFRKYKDKAWYQGPDATPATANSSTLQRTAGGGTTSGRGVAGAMRQPTVVAHLPPKAKVAAVMDLFDAPPTAAAVDEWDAFSTRRTQPAGDDFANFGGSSSNATPEEQQPPGSSDFANFDEPTSNNVPPPPASHPDSFAAFPSLNSAAAPASQAGMNPSMNTNGMMMSSSTISSQPQQNYPSSNQFAAFPSNAAATPTADGFANFDSLSMVHAHPVASSTEPAPPGAMNHMAPPAQMTQTPHDKFDAFNSLQMPSPMENPASDNAASAWPMNGDTTVPPTNVVSMNAASTVASKNEAKTAKYQSGQKVYYKSASYVGPAEVVKVHWDDALEPFYTIHAEGKEKQTDDAHLSEAHPLQQEIQALLAQLSVDQLNQVQQYIISLSTVPTSPLSNATSTMHMTPTSAPNQISHPPPPMPVSSHAPGAPAIPMVTQPTGQSRPNPPQNWMPTPSQTVQSMPNPPQNLPMTHGHPQAPPQQQMPSSTNMPPLSPHHVSTQNMQQLSMQHVPLSGIPSHQVAPPTNAGASSGGIQPMPDTSMMMNASNVGGGFSGIPSPGAMHGANPSVQNGSLPPPPLVQGGLGMMHPPQGQFPASTPMTPMASQGYMMPQYPGTFHTGSHPPMAYPQGPASLGPSQPVPPQSQLQSDPAPQSPLSPKGNPFDFY